MSLLVLVSRTLSSRGIAHALVGGLALAAHGLARSTMDADVLVVEVAEHEEEIWDLLRREGAKCDVRRGDADDPFRAVVRITAARSDPVDVLVGRFRWQQEVIARASPTTLPEGRVPVVGAADLVLLKLFAGGPQDLLDIRRILESKDREQIVADVDTRVSVLPQSCRDEWETLRARG